MIRIILISICSFTQFLKEKIKNSIIALLAIWMFLRTNRDLRAAKEHNGNHSHSELLLVDTIHGKLELSVFEDGVSPVFQLRAPKGTYLTAKAEMEIVYPDGSRQTFNFINRGDFLESSTSIPELHEFDADIILRHNGQIHTTTVKFCEDCHHHHHENRKEFQDAHERAHAQDIVSRFQGQAVTIPQIILFGITGGRMPCTATFTVLLVCLELKKVSLGFTMVGAFSFGLAISMVAAGVIASLGVQASTEAFQRIYRDNASGPIRFIGTFVADRHLYGLEWMDPSAWMSGHTLKKQGITMYAV